MPGPCKRCRRQRRAGDSQPTLLRKHRRHRKQETQGANHVGAAGAGLPDHAEQRSVPHARRLTAHRRRGYHDLRRSGQHRYYGQAQHQVPNTQAVRACDQRPAVVDKEYRAGGAQRRSIGKGFEHDPRRIPNAERHHPTPNANVPFDTCPSSTDRTLHCTTYFPTASAGSATVTCAAAGALRSTVTGTSLPSTVKVKTASRTFSLKLSVSDFGATCNCASAAGTVLCNLACAKTGPLRTKPETMTAKNQALAIIALLYS